MNSIIISTSELPPTAHVQGFIGTCREVEKSQMTCQNKLISVVGPNILNEGRTLQN